MILILLAVRNNVFKAKVQVLILNKQNKIVTTSQNACQKYTVYCITYNIINITNEKYASLFAFMTTALEQTDSTIMCKT